MRCTFISLPLSLSPNVFTYVTVLWWDLWKIPRSQQSHICEHCKPPSTRGGQVTHSETLRWVAGSDEHVVIYKLSRSSTALQFHRNKPFLPQWASAFRICPTSADTNAPKNTVVKQGTGETLKCISPAFLFHLLVVNQNLNNFNMTQENVAITEIKAQLFDRSPGHSVLSLGFYCSPETMKACYGSLLPMRTRLTLTFLAVNQS